MNPVVLHHKPDIEAVLRRNPVLYNYALGDLDDFFWPYTTWHALASAQAIQQIALLYTGTNLPVLLALTEAPPEMAALLQAIHYFLPRRVYAHLSPGLLPVLAETYQPQAHGTYFKMALTQPAKLEGVETSAVEPLTVAHLAELKALYQLSYPGNWFDPRMLETGRYYGLRQAGQLVAVAGIHVYSPRYGVAALGNITTHPEFRGQGLATQVTAKLGQVLTGQIEYIGLNVRADNAAAIACYERLGFERVAIYEEWMLEG